MPTLFLFHPCAYESTLCHEGTKPLSYTIYKLHCKNLNLFRISIFEFRICHRAFSNSSRISRCTSVIVPCISQPAAYLWPPPPNFPAIVFTLKPFRLRRLTLIQLGSVISRSNTP